MPIRIFPNAFPAGLLVRFLIGCRQKVLGRIVITCAKVAVSTRSSRFPSLLLFFPPLFSSLNSYRRFIVLVRLDRKLKKKNDQLDILLTAKRIIVHIAIVKFR